jgi:hypothetical protein
MLTLASLPQPVIDQIAARRWDRIIEKHEGPWPWASTLRTHNPEFLTIAGYDVLLPVPKQHHAAITILRCIPSADGESLTIFLKDATYAPSPDDERLYAGFVAVCDRFRGQPFFVAHLYHEWFIIDDVVQAS